VGSETTALVRVRAICLALPGASECLSHGTPAFFAGKQFVMCWPRGHHDAAFAHLWCAAPPGVQHELVSTEPDRFFRPPYVASRGWIGVHLDGEIDWREIEEICVEAYRTVASKRLRDALDARAAPAGPPSVTAGRRDARRPSGDG
jgi:hypothetical protein